MMFIFISAWKKATRGDEEANAIGDSRGKMRAERGTVLFGSFLFGETAKDSDYHPLCLLRGLLIAEQILF